MNEMIERVAKAIRVGMLGSLASDKNSFDKLSKDGKTMYINAAKAAIEAMREPTEEMIRSAAENSENDLIIEYWQAMINAALK